MAVNFAEIGDKLKDRRKQLDLSQSDAARRASISKDLWKEVEDGELAPLSDQTLVSIAQALKLPPAGFLSKCGRDPKAAASAGTGSSGSPTSSRRSTSGTRLVPGVWIHDRRAGLGVTRGEAARRAGVSQSVWRDIENDAMNPDDETVAKVAEALYLEPSQLMKVYGRTTRPAR